MPRRKRNENENKCVDEPATKRNCTEVPEKSPENVKWVEDIGTMLISSVTVTVGGEVYSKYVKCDKCSRLYNELLSPCCGCQMID